MRRHLRLVAACAAVSLLSGCFGSFLLVRKLYEFNADFESEFVQSALFWAFVILPVYEFAALGDAFVLNVIEFWSGENPLEDGPGLPDEIQVKRAGDDALRVQRTTPGGVKEIELVRVGTRAGMVRAPDGTILAAAEILDDGAIAVTAHGRVRMISAEHVRRLASTVGSGRLMASARELFWSDQALAGR